MSIETLLTLALAAALLVAAALLRLSVLGLIRVVMKLSGRVTGSEPEPDRATGVRTRPQVAPALRRGLATTASRSTAALSTLSGRAEGLARRGAGGMRSAGARTDPQVSSWIEGAERTMRSVSGWLRPRLVVLVAALQHLLEVAAARAAEARRAALPPADTTEPESPRETSATDRVIQLGPDFDYLNDPFPEERLISRR